MTRFRQSALRRAPVLAACLLLGLGMKAGCAESAVPTDRPDPAVDVRHYDLRLRVDPAPLRVEGRVEIAVRHPGPVRVVRLLLFDLTVDTVRVDGAVVAAVRRGERLDVPVDAAADSSRIRVVYHGRPRQGLYVAEAAGQSVLYTDSWPDRTRGWLPSVDHPSDPATLTLTLDLPLGVEPVAGGRELRLDTLDGRFVSAWTLGASAPTYAFAFAAADFAFTAAESAGLEPAGPPVRYALLAADSARTGLLARTPEALAFFGATIGPYPFASYTVVEAPIGYGGMENAGLPFLAVDLFHGAADLAESVQVHEAAHQWFGSRVTLGDWRDLWLSEGMATFLTAQFYAHADGLDAARARWVDLARLRPEELRRHTPLVPDGESDPNARLTWVPYRKGACVLHLLRLFVGDAAFDAALRRAYREYAGRPFSTAAWQGLLEEASGRELDDFFAYWVYGDRLPVLELTWEAARQRLRWRVVDNDATLAGLPVELEVRQGGGNRYARLLEAALELPARERPDVRPVGVPMRVRWRDP